MAIYEFTQQIVKVNPAEATPYYAALQPNPGVYIIKGMNCYSTTGLVTGGTGASVSIINSNALSTPSIADYIYSTSTPAAANSILEIFTPGDGGVILTQPNIGFITFVPSSTGTFYINMSYVYIPTTNVNSAKFSNHVASVTNTTGAAFTGLSALYPTIIKSILIVNYQNSATNIVLYLNGVAFDFIALAAASTHVVPIPIYLSNIQTLTVSSSSLTPVQVIYSYTLN